jgi:hypothetical protein
MVRTERAVSGLPYLDLVTDLLHRARLADSFQGIWEAADFQWWWRRDQHRNPGTQVFLMEDENPLAGVVLTDWGGRSQIDLLFTSRVHSGELKELWPAALELVTLDASRLIDLEVPTDDHELIKYAIEAGFKLNDEENWTCWMPASDRPEILELPSGFLMQSRTQTAERHHPMAGRNGGDFEARLAECSLYDPNLDLAVYSPDGEVAGYGLFWSDPVTRVGLIEPIRTNEAFQGNGIASCILAAGLDRLARSGCEQMKVSTDLRLYLNSGFRKTSSSFSLSKG